jgi:hypothetical protein
MSRKYFWAIAAVASIYTTIFAANSALAATGTCRTTQIAYNSNPQMDVSTDSATFIDVPNTAVTFTQTVMGCVVVQLTVGETSNSLTDDLRVRAKFAAGSVNAVPGEATLLSYNGATVQFLFTDVPPGSHTVKIRYRSASGTGYPVFLSKTLVVVNYR